MNTKATLRVISLVLFVTVFGVWIFFYFIISGYIEDNTRQQITLAAGQIIERLGDEFSEAEGLTYSLKQSETIQALMREQDRRRFFFLVGVTDSLYTGEYDTSFINSIVLYGVYNHAYRLAGTLGNKACSLLYDAVSALELPSHLSIELDGKKYIGYADEISDIGSVVVLIEEEKILEVLRAYDQSGSLLVVIRANGEIVTANTEEAEQIDRLSLPVIHSSLGVTPYEISVAANQEYMNASEFYFSIVAVITAAIFAAVLFIYTGVLNRSFFRPMVSVIGNIRQLQTGMSAQRLPYVRRKEFDYLIDKINEMLLHIEAKNMEIRVADLRAKNAEIDKQKALVFSLKKQINAHFTVNTLEAIRTAVEQGELDKAESVMAALMRIVRYAHSKEEYVNIWDEIEILKYYAEIMNSRYGGKLTAEFDFDEDLMDSDMPRMLLQPLMENAITHGFKDMDSGCVISVKAQMHGGVIAFSVSDNGCGMDAQTLAELSKKLHATPDTLDGLTNIALLNIRNRLYHAFGGAARMEIKPSESGGLTVAFVIPAFIAKGGTM